MMGYRRLSLLAIATALALAAAQSPALADARIFTAKSSAPGVTIDQAFRNGDPLAVVGHGDGTTLFRIDSPSTPVGCANKIEFVTSTGEHVEQLADMCALNWNVTVNVKAAAASGDNAGPAPAAGGGAIPAVPPADSAFAQTVTLSSDDPSATILAVTLDGTPVAITGREGDAVKFEIAGTDQGIVCDRTVGLTLSDGREITRKANICLNNWTVVIAAGEGAAPPPTTPELPTPPTETPAPPVVQAPLAPNPEMVWMFASAGNTATVAHGVPETDESNFSASCVRGSGNISVTVLDSSIPGVVPGSAVPITFSAGSFARTYPGIGSPMDQIVGASLPEVQISAADPLWSAMIRETTLGVTIASAWQSTISLAGSAGPTRQLLAACSPGAVAPPPAAFPAPPPVGPGIVARFFCDNGEAITVTFNGAQQTAVLTEAGAPPLVLHWDPSRSSTRYSAGPARLVLPSDGEARWSRFGGPAVACFEG
jgi:hypothetical protein